MGKDLKGKKLPAGICQRKDGRYTARFTSKSGKRVEKVFKKLTEAKVWIKNIKEPTVRFNTVRNYDV